MLRIAALLAFILALPLLTQAQAAAPAPRAAKTPAKPKLVVLLVVDQMRADYVDKFLPQWTGGLKRLGEEGAWFPAPAHPYAATETPAPPPHAPTPPFPCPPPLLPDA